MNYTDLQQQIALTLLEGTGKKRMRHILAHIGSVAAFFQEKKQNLLKISGLGTELLARMDREKALKMAEIHVEYCIKNTLHSYFFQSDDFPSRLNHCEDAPLLLFGRGNMQFNNKKTVAIVGTRNASAYGREICEELIQSLAGKDIVVVSGLAYGIDIHVHQLCVQAGIQTIAVLGHGLDRLYPSVHRQTALKMLENGGLLTEFLPGTKPDRMNFPMRNRIVAGMCDATIVVESGAKGGSLITAELANDYNREVFAYPGDITRELSSGCNHLIQQNRAHLITQSKDFFRLMDWDQGPAKQKEIFFPDLSPEELTLVKILGEKQNISLEALAIKTQTAVHKVSTALLNLEFMGVIKSLPGKRFSLT